MVGVDVMRVMPVRTVTGAASMIASMRSVWSPMSSSSGISTVVVKSPCGSVEIVASRVGVESTQISSGVFGVNPVPLTVSDAPNSMSNGLSTTGG